jgi:hypothetical protein
MRVATSWPMSVDRAESLRPKSSSSSEMLLAEPPSSVRSALHEPGGSPDVGAF